MAMRLHELHPMMTHFPIALLPTTLGIDLAAHITENEDLEALGRVTITGAAATSILAAAAGLVAEQEVQGNPRAQSMLRTHKTLNLAGGAVTSAMSAYRIAKPRPGWGYMAVGVANLGLVAYSAYLGGRMVYGEGMGVESADGLRRDRSPEIRPGNLTHAIATFGRQLKAGVSGLFRGLVPRDRELMDDEYFQEQLRRDNERPGALPIGPTR